MVPSSLLIALFLSSLMFPFSSARIVGVSVVDICSKHTNPLNCNSIMYSIPGIADGVSLDIFAPLCLSLCSVNAYEGLNLVSYLEDQGTTDPSWKQIYSTCYSDYAKAIVSVEKARDSLRVFDYAALNSNLTDASGFVKDCAAISQNDPSTMPRFNSYVVDISGITMIISDYLAGKYGKYIYN